MLLCQRGFGPGGLCMGGDEKASQLASLTKKKNQGFSTIVSYELGAHFAQASLC